MLAVLLPTDRSRGPIWLLIPPPIHLTARPKQQCITSITSGQRTLLSSAGNAKAVPTVLFDRSSVIHLEAPQRRR